MCGNKNYQRKFDEKLKERFFNTYKFSGHDNSKFILLHKGVYQYEYMFDWEKFSEKLFPEKEAQESFLAILLFLIYKCTRKAILLFLIYKCTRKPFLWNLFVVDRICEQRKDFFERKIER